MCQQYGESWLWQQQQQQQQQQQHCSLADISARKDRLLRVSCLHMSSLAQHSMHERYKQHCISALQHFQSVYLRAVSSC
jgi:hypothetical protein